MKREIVTRRKVRKKLKRPQYGGKKGRSSVVHVTRIPERREENGAEETFEEIMTRNFPELMTDIRPWTSSRSPVNPKQDNYNSHLIIVIL